MRGNPYYFCRTVADVPFLLHFYLTQAAKLQIAQNKASEHLNPFLIRQLIDSPELFSLYDIRLCILSTETKVTAKHRVVHKQI